MKKEVRKQILLLGDSALYKKSIAVQKGEDLTQWVQDLHDTLMDYRKKHHGDRVIAASQHCNKKVVKWWKKKWENSKTDIAFGR